MIVPIVSAIVLLFAVVALVGCETDQPLATPQNVSLSSLEVFSWDEVDGADYYIVDVNGTEYETEETFMDLLT